MIRIHGRPYNLPHDLMPCPKCARNKRRGRLRWDGRWSWRCSDARRDAEGNLHGCENGITLAALFEGDELETIFTLGRVDITRLALTGLAVRLLRVGEIHFPWVDDSILARHTRALTGRQAEEDRFEGVDRLMRALPGADEDSGHAV